jgi:DNA-binding transcriptional LysR family regulator
LEGVLGGATLQLIVFVSNDVRCGGNEGLQDEGDSGDFERSDDGGVVGDSVNHDVHLLGQIEDIESNIVSEQAALSGRIRLAAPTVFGRCHLGPAINDFIALHPQIEFDIEFNDRHIDIIDEGFDLTVRIAKLDDSRMIARRLARVTASVAASPEYRHRNGKPRRVQDLSNHRALHYSYRLTSTWRCVHPRGRKGSVRGPGEQRRLHCRCRDCRTRRYSATEIHCSRSD